jgi:hypothetical protein
MTTPVTTDDETTPAAPATAKAVLRFIAPPSLGELERKAVCAR